MRKFLLGMTTFAAVMLGGAAQAADLPRKAPAPPPLPVMYNWTGFYIGGHIGGAWVDREGHHRFDNCIGAVCFHDRVHGDDDGSFLAGGQIGFNYQVGSIVWGVEGQASWVDHDNDHACGFFTWGAVNDHLFRCRNGGDWVATLAVRLGVAVGATGNWLLYVKGGAAFADAGLDIRRRNDCPWAFCDNNNAFLNNGDDTRTGWMVGFGVENGFAGGNWSWKLEYNFMDFGDDNHRFDHAFAGCGGCRLGHDFDLDTQVHVVKLGINYRFGYAAPVAARY
jgi:outer membrane immunogenic protein